MAEFNADKYFFNRSEQILNDPTRDVGVEILNDTIRRRQEREYERQQRLRALDVLEQQRREKELSWSSRLGLDPDRLPGQAVNIGAHVAATTTRMGGEALTAAPDIAAAGLLQDVSDEAKAAYNRERQDIATEEDINLLNQDRNRFRIDVALQNLERAENIREFADTSSIIHHGARDRFSADLEGRYWRRANEQIRNSMSQWDDGSKLKAADQMARGVGNLVRQMGSAIFNNPDAIAGYVSEIIPQLALGRVSKTALLVQSLGYGFASYNKGVAKYAAENNGALPPDDLNAYMAYHAVFAGVVNHLSTLGLLGITTKPAKKGVGSAVGRIGKATAGGFGIEAVTELAQTYALGEAELQSKTPFELYEAFTIGGASGAGVAGPGRVVSEMAQATPEHMERQRQEAAAAAERAGKIIEAIETSKDYDQFLNPEDTANFAPYAVVRELAKKGSDPNLSESDREGYIAEIEQVLNKAEENSTELKEDIDGRSSEQKLAQRKKNLVKLKAKDNKTAQDYTAIAALKGAIATREKMPPSEVKKLQQEAKQLEQEVEKIKAALSFVKGEFNPTTDHMTELVDLVQSMMNQEGQDPSASNEAAAVVTTEVIRHAMANPALLSLEQAQMLAEKAPTAEAREFFQRFTEARMAYNSQQTRDNVTKDIVDEGSRQSRSLNQYRELISSALAKGDTNRVNKLMADLRSFEASHVSKSVALGEALRKVSPNDTPRTVARRNPNDPGSWYDTGELWSNERRVKEGGFTVHNTPGTIRTISRIGAEAELITKTRQELEAGIAVGGGIALKGDVTSRNIENPPRKTPSTNQPKGSVTPAGESVSSTPSAARKQSTKKKDTPSQPANKQETSKPAGEQKSAPKKPTEKKAESQTPAKKGAGKAADAAGTIDPPKPKLTGRVEFFEGNWSRKDVDESPGKIFVFGDNMVRRGKGGQAVIRDAENVVGIRTKWAPHEKEAAYFGRKVEDEKAAITEDINKIISLRDQGKTIVMPKAGVGTGRAQLESRAPEVWEHLQKELARAGLVERAAEPKAKTPKQDTVGGFDLTRSTNKSVNELRGTIREWKQLEKEYKEVDVAMRQEDVSDAKALELENKDDALSERQDQLIRELMPVLERLKEHPSEAAQEAVQAFLESVTVQANEFDPATVIQELINIGQIATEYDTATRDMFGDGSQTKEGTQAPKQQTQGETRSAKERTPTQEAASQKRTGEEPVAARAPEPSPTPVSDQPATKSEGRLSLFREKTERIAGTVGSKRFYTVNRVKNYVNQSGSNPKLKTQRPLVMERDFLSKFLSNSNLLRNYYNPKVGLTDQQQTLVELLGKTLWEWNQVLEGIIEVNPNSAYDYTQYMQYFLDKTSENPVKDLDENLKTAISLAAFSWAAENGNAIVYSDNEQINRILHRRDEHLVTSAERKLLSKAGISDKTMINKLGKRITDVLGLKALKDAPQEVQSKMEASLGAHALGILMEKGIVERHPVVLYKQGDKPRITDPEGLSINFYEGSQGIVHPMIRLKLDAEGNPPAIAQEIYETHKDTQGLISKVFGAEMSKKLPSVAPVDYQQESVKRTKGTVPSKLEQILQGENEKAHVIRQDSFRVLNNLRNSLGDQFFMSMFGWKDMNSYRAHKANKDAIEGKNQGIERGLSDLDEFISYLTEQEKGIATPFYLDRFMAKPQRVFLDSLFNPQNNMMHRMIMAMEGWESTVSLTPGDASLNLFKTAMAEALGLKSDAGKKADKLLRDDLVELFDRELVQHTADGVVFANEALETAVRALQQVQYGDHVLSVTEGEAIREVVEKAGEEGHSFDGLIHLAHYVQAIESGQDSFTTQAVLEVDGISNGPMLAMIFQGAANSLTDLISEGERGGFYTQQSEHDSFASWNNEQNKINQDIYESTMSLAGVFAVKNRANPKLAGVYTAIFSIMGELYQFDDDGIVSATSKGRKASKSFVTPVKFGSSVQNGVEAMADTMIQKIYDDLESLANKEMTEEERKEKGRQILGNAFRIMKHGNARVARSFKPGKTFSDYLDYEFSTAEINAIRTGFTATFGQDVGNALNRKFKVFLARRKRLNQSVNVAFELYNQIAETLYNSLVTYKGRNGELALSKDGKQLEGLAGEDRARLGKWLEKVYPIANTFFSQESGDIQSGMHIPKMEQRLADSSIFEGQTKFSKYIPSNFTGKWPVIEKGKLVEGGKDKRKHKTLKTAGQELIESNPGVGVLIMLVHSSDSAIASMAYQQLKALNVHDALIMSLHEASQGAELLNHNTFNVLLNFSLPMEMANSLERTINGMLDILEESNNAPHLVEAFKTVEAAVLKEITRNKKEKARFEESGLSPLAWILHEAKAEAHKAEFMKLSYLSQLRYIGQYGLEGGSYTVTDADRQLAKEKLTALGAVDKATINRLQKRAAALKDVQIKRENFNDLVDAIRVSGEEQTAPKKKHSTAQVATTLKTWAGSVRKRIIDRGQQHSDKAKSDLATLMKLNSAFTKHGSLEKALLEVFPGDGNKTKRAKTKKHIHDMLDGKVTTAKTLDNAHDFDVLNTLDHAIEQNSEHTELLKKAKTYMLEHNTGIESALLVNASASDAAATFAYLERAYHGERNTGWGTLGLPIVESDTELVRFLSTVPNRSVGKVIGHLLEGNTNAFQKELLRKLQGILDPNLPIEYVTAQTLAPVIPLGDVTKARGWYESVDKERIVLKSPDFQESGLTSELVIHELLHAALSGIIDAELKRSKPTTTERYRLVQDLVGLRDSVEAYLKQAGNEQLLEQYGEAINTVHELVSWGMSNAGFQQQVLNQVKYETQSKTGRGVNRLISGMKQFIETIKGLIFQGTKHQLKADHGLEVLIADVSGLFNQVSKSKAAAAKKRFTHTDPNPLNDVDQYTSEQIFDSLAQDHNPVDGAFQQHLKGVLNTVVTAIHGPQGIFRLDDGVPVPQTIGDIWHQTVARGETPFTSKITGLQIPLREQEAYVVEQIEATIRKETLDPKTPAYRELVKTYKAAKAALSPKDFLSVEWDQATNYEKSIAQDRYDAVFRIEIGQDGFSDHLSRFAALGLGWQELNQKLTNITTPSTRGQAKTLNDHLKNAFEWIMQAIGKRVMGVWEGQQADEQLLRVVQNLSTVEARKRMQVKSHWSHDLNKVTEQLDKAVNAVKEGADKVVSSPKLRGHSNAFVRAASGMASAATGGRLELMADLASEFRNKIHKGRLGIVADTWNDMRGTTDRNAVFMELLRETKRLERERMKYMTEHEKLVLIAFENDGKDLTTEQKASVTALMRMDVSSLTDHYLMPRIREFVGDRKARYAEIRRKERELRALKGHSHYYIYQAQNLGLFMATGSAQEYGLHLNAHNIAQMYGTSQAGKVPAQTVEQAAAIIDTLATLYALEYMPQAQRVEAESLMRQEEARGDQNGVELVLRNHLQLLKESRETLFADDPIHFTKGYVPEITDPHKEIVVVDEVKGKTLEEFGWVKGPKVTQDVHDPDQRTKHIYVLNDGGNQSWVTGIASMTDNHMKGTKVDYMGSTVNHLHSTQRVEIEAQIRGERKFKAGTATASKPVYNLNNQGFVTGFRYMMNHNARDTLLKRDNRMEKVLGLMAGRLVDKQTNTNQNKELIKALHEQYKADYLNNPSAYVEISLTSNDAIAQETYRLLPEQTKKDIREIWGDEKMLVHNEILNMAFGYRKLSLGNMFKKDRKDRNFVEIVMVGMLEGYYDYHTKKFQRTLIGKKAELRVRQIERGTMEVAQMIKDFIVVKSPATLMLNIISGLSQLMWADVSIKEIYEGIPVAVRHTLQYQEDYGELIRLRQRVSMGYIQDLNETNERIIELEDAINRNPMKEMIDAGMMQTIVEDINPDDETYTYKTQLIRQMDSATQMVPQIVKEGAKQLFMTHDTSMYKFMSQATMFVDLASRYILANHLINRKKDPMSKRDAYKRAYEEFVAYDIPQNPYLQYVDDIGLFRFTKYYLRIQKVLLRLAKENPARTLQILAFGHLFDVSTLPDVSVLNHNPFDLKGGPLDLPDAISRAATFDVLGSAVR